MCTKRVGAVLALGLLAVGLLLCGASAVQAQQQSNPPSTSPNPPSTNPWIAPGISQNQLLAYLMNLRLSGQGFSTIPPWVLGFAQLPPGVVNPPLPPLFNPVNPYGIGANPYAAGVGAPTNPYQSTMPYPPNDPYGYNPYGYGYDPAGGILRGQAEVIRAYGSSIQAMEYARILREQAKQARIETERKRFDHEMYIKANTPTFTEEQQKIAKSVLRRIQSTATPNEIWGGKSLNILLDDLRKYPNKKSAIEPMHLSESVLRHLNVTGTNGNLGLLRDNGRFDWPLALLELVPEEKRKEIEVRAQALVYKAANGKVEAGQLIDLRRDLDKIRDDLTKKVNDTYTPNYIEAKRFLSDFEDARVAIEKGDAPKYFEFQKFVANGKTLQEVVDFMVKNGLRFAPAVQGDEPAYQALHSAMAAYDIALNTYLEPNPTTKDY